LLVADELSTVELVYALLHLARKPVVVIHEALYRFLGERLGIAATLGSDAGELCLGVGTERDAAPSRGGG
jgi:hypothetical protein